MIAELLATFSRPAQICFGKRVAIRSRWLAMLTIVIGCFAHHSQALAFNCGPNALTYSAADSAGNLIGIRCVKYHFHSAPNGAINYDFEWYAEGRAGIGTYRQVGAACSNLAICTPATGVAAYISGNGEAFQGKLGEIRVTVTEPSVSPSFIRLDGALNETWHLTSNANYTPLAPAASCGAELLQYEVRGPASSGLGPVAGLRCALNTGMDKIVWYGTGQWSQPGSPYLHLGSASYFVGVPVQGGASDLCDASVGAHCNEFAYGSLVFSVPSNYQGLRVGGAWNEYWIRPGTYVPPTPPKPRPKPPICETRWWLPQCADS